AHAQADKRSRWRISGAFSMPSRIFVQRLGELMDARPAPSFGQSLGSTGLQKNIRALSRLFAANCLICVHLRNRRRIHLPFHTGFLFSIHAAIPSFTSSVCISSSR